MKTSKGYRCNAEVGRPGNYHACCAKAHYKVRGKFGILLHYCERHRPQDAEPLTHGDYVTL